MKTQDRVWSNDNEFLKIEMNGRPSCKILSFVLENNKARFTKISEINKEELPKFLNRKKFKPTNKILALV
ncbi:MAG: hypothetical protein PHF86_04305 [Candidatus Nanoarchaeia archaeon]|jgi:hypothetical protein|nr:hypothetical protein [Candidatus Nanoarchaeia archaeon]